MDKFCIILLAAGKSERFGSPKQLLKFNGKTLIEHVAETAASTGFPVVTVLGANAEEIMRRLNHENVEVVINFCWKHGMSSSIVCGLTHILQHKPNLEAVIILLADQPLVTKHTIKKLSSAYRKTQKSVVGAHYGNSMGVPAIFSHAMFDALLQLKGKHGAKTLINSLPANCLHSVELPEVLFDIDTVEDFKALQMKLNSNA
ncbi:MAG: NTP transferase domain-containing protein [Pyrinomonadaceae bacterium]